MITFHSICIYIYKQQKYKKVSKTQKKFYLNLKNLYVLKTNYDKIFKYTYNQLLSTFPKYDNCVAKSNSYLKSAKSPRTLFVVGLELDLNRFIYEYASLTYPLDMLFHPTWTHLRYEYASLTHPVVLKIETQQIHPRYDFHF